MPPSSTISSKGQVTIPREVRKRLGLKAGDRVEFIFDDDRTAIRPARTPNNPFTKYKGAFPAFANTREINAWIKHLREEDEHR